MYCKHCGTQLGEASKFCPNCGAAQTSEPAHEPEILLDPSKEMRKDNLAGEVLKWGIMSLAFSSSGLLALLGWIFAGTAKKKVTAYESEFGETTGRARVGKILGKVGLGVGIGYTIFFTLYFLFLIMIAILVAETNMEIM